MEIVLEILKYTVPALVVFATAYLLVRTKLKEDSAQIALRNRLETRKDMLPLRLQAYERLVLFMERLDFVNLVPRVNEPEFTVRMLQQQLIAHVKAEFEHNISQQLYVSKEVWAAVVFVKDGTIKHINLSAATLDPAAPGKELAKMLIGLFQKQGVASPTRHAIEIIHDEVKTIF